MRRAALAERERGAARSTSSVFRHPPTTPLDLETGQITGERAHVALAVAAMRVVMEWTSTSGWTRVVWTAWPRRLTRLDRQAVEGQIQGGIAQGSASP